MRKRWLPVLLLAVALFAVNVVSRLVIRLGFNGNETAEDRASLVMFSLVAVMLGVAAFRRARSEPVERWSGDLLAAALLAMLATVLLGPFVSGDTPFAQGAGAFFSQIWLYAGFAGAGLLVGYLVVTALGWDHRSQSLKRMAQLSRAKPRRVVRR